MVIKKLDSVVVHALVDSSEGPQEALLKLYEHITDDWDTIDHLEGFPHVNQKTAGKILDLMHEKWDALSVNLVWLNNGFGNDEDVPDWYVYYDEAMIVRKDMTDPLTTSLAKKSKDHEQENL